MATPDTFTAFVVDQQDGQTTAELRQISRDQLPEGDVLVRVAYTGLNYKDGLAVRNRNKVIRAFPMVPGIDFAGTVLESQSPRYQPGDRVVLTGWGVGERYWGGFAQLASVKSEWLVPMPERFSLQEVMGIGTAGVTAMLAILALEDHGLQPGGREVLVTGAGGGVGSFAVALLAASGYSAVAATTRAETADYLKALGASEVISSREITESTSGPLGPARWGGAVDTVGGATLPGVIRTLAYGASVAACGNAGGFDVPTNVLPFILRSVNVLGIDSLPAPFELRQRAWQRIAETLPQEALTRIMSVAPLSKAPELADEILAGRVRGHIALDVNA